MQKKASIIALIGLIKLYKDNIVSVIYIFQYFNLNESRVKKKTRKINLRCIFTGYNIFQKIIHRIKQAVEFFF